MYVSQNIPVKIMRTDFAKIPCNELWLEPLSHYIWAGTQDLRTYRIAKRRRLRRVCTYVKTCLSLRCLYAQSMDIDEDNGQNLDLGHLDTSEWKFYCMLVKIFHASVVVC